MLDSFDKKSWQIILAGSFSGIIATILIFNFPTKSINHRFLIILITYLILFILFKKVTAKSDLLIFISLVVAPFMIDLSVLFTNKNLIPVRFPISTGFIIFGTLLGIVLLKSTLKKIVVVGFALSYYFLSAYYFVPYSIFKKEKIQSNFNPLFLSSKFLTRNGDTLNLQQSKNKCILIDFMFVGCAPCELKRNMFSEIDKELADLDFDIYIICNGSISSFAKFKNYCDLNPEGGRVKFLYDYNYSIAKFFPEVNTYPFELFLNKSNLLNSYLGISNETFSLHKQDRIKTIRKLAGR